MGIKALPLGTYIMSVYDCLPPPYNVYLLGILTKSCRTPVRPAKKENEMGDMKPMGAAGDSKHSIEHP